MALSARQEEEQNTQKRSGILGLTYVDTAQITNKQIFKDILSKEDLYKFRVIPIFADRYNISFGITNNTSQQTIAFIRSHFLDQRLSFSLISDTGFADYMKLYDPPKEVIYQDIDINENKNQQIELSDSVSKILDQISADDMLAYLVQQAHKLNASDIHIETQTTGVRIRFRIDGVLHPIAELSVDKYRVLLSAIASGGNISTSSDQAQQGHISENVKMANGNEVKINLRLETTPTINGMDAVMRLFNMRDDMFTLERLGLSVDERKLVDDIIKKPSGLVLVVGPTGSGKTTTLYSILRSLSSPERKIITIEDPVEYQFPGITQISVASKSTTENNFAERLRAVLRLDPDVVMVGEIRDNDTASTALQAALTGHLVLATFHASSASAALARLENIIGQNPLFISSIRFILIYNFVPFCVVKPNMIGLKLYKPGSTESNPFGYSGQMAIREQFQMTGEILELLKSNNATSIDGLEQAAINSGMKTMLQDGILKVIAGLTTLDELYRVIG